jgi:uncharacterized membrane protein YfcA
MWLAASLQGVTGFGFMMLAVPGLILGIPAQVVVPALILVWLPLGTVQVVQLRRDVDWRLLAYLVASAVVGLPLGAMILRETDTETMQRGIGAMMVALALLLQLKPGLPFQRERVARVGAGFIGGVLASSTSVSGPPLVLLGMKQQWQTDRFRATLPAYFLAISVCCLPLHWEMDLLNRSSVELALSGLPGVALGYLTGVWLKGRVRGDGFRWAVLGMVMGGGLAAVVF